MLEERQHELGREKVVNHLSAAKEVLKDKLRLGLGLTFDVDGLTKAEKFMSEARGALQKKKGASLAHQHTEDTCTGGH